MNATSETRFALTLDGCIKAAEIRDRSAERIEPTQAGRATVARIQRNKTVLQTITALVHAAEGMVRIQPTKKGRAYVACVKAEEETINACAAIQEGASPTVLAGPHRRLNEALVNFQEVTGERFYPQEIEAAYASIAQEASDR